MGQPYVGEIRIFAGNFQPAGWQFCAGQLLPISEYETLFNLIGTTYGGDGQSTFGIPDLRGRLPVHMGQGLGLSTRVIGQLAGVETVTLTLQQLPQHNHGLFASQNTAAASAVAGNVTGQTGSTQIYRETTAASPFAASMMEGIGGSQPHDNFQPYLCLNYIISLFGIFPSPN